MSNLNLLLDRLKARQRDLVMYAAELDVLPSDSMIRKIAELENAIAAVEALIGEQAKRGV